MAKKKTTSKIILQHNMFEEKKIDIFVDNEELFSSVPDEDVQSVVEDIKTSRVEIISEVKKTCNEEGLISCVDVVVEVDNKKQLRTQKNIPYKQVYEDHNNDNDFLAKLKRYFGTSIKSSSKVKIISVFVNKKSIGLWEIQ